MYPSTSAEPMTPSQIDTALYQLASDAIACIERTLRGSIKPVKAQVDCAWRVLEIARDRECEESLKASTIEDFQNVLQLVEP